MAVLIVTSKVAYFPDPEEQEGWRIEKEDGLEFYTAEIGPHKLFWTKCIKDIDKRVEEKHKVIADIVKRVKKMSPLTKDESFYLIAHDLDLLLHNDEGRYSDKKDRIIDSSLVSLIPDTHIYVFRHSPKSEMFNTLVIKNSIEGERITLDDINKALALINQQHV